MVLDALRLTRAGLDSGVPLLHTIFSPLTIAQKLSNRRAVVDLRQEPDKILPALETIVEATRTLTRRSLDYGADGIFFATQCADAKVMSIDEYKKWALPLDQQVLSVVEPGKVLVLHLHGSQPHLGLQEHLPSGFLNWHDRHSGPPLASIRSEMSRPVAGGIDEQTAATDSADTMAAAARDAVLQCGGRGMMVAPGCVLPTATPASHIHRVVAAARAVETG
jgi:uroporphyrinogen decarboxylase